MRDIERMSCAKQWMVEVLAGNTGDHGLRVVAAGTNSDGEINFCVDTGIRLLAAQSIRRAWSA